MNIPKQSIAWLVARSHVSVSDEAIKQLIRIRCKGPGWTEAKIVEAEKYAVRCHHKNSDLYHTVMSGRF